LPREAAAAVVGAVQGLKNVCDLSFRPTSTGRGGRPQRYSNVAASVSVRKRSSLHCTKTAYIPGLPSFVLILAKPGRGQMPRFFFNVVEGHSQTLVRDSEGAIFLSLDEARKEAVGLARDFAKHRFYRPMQTWKLVVADENGHHALTVSLCDIRPRKISTWVDQIRHFAMFETRIHPNILGWLLAAAMIGVLVQSAVKTASVSRNTELYQAGSARTEGSHR
jgi:hypothetical protein